MTTEQKAARVIAILESLADTTVPFSEKSQRTIQLRNAAYGAPKPILAQLYDTIRS